MFDRKFRSDALFGYIAQAGTVGLGFVFMLVVTRFGSVETYGELMLLVSISSLIGNLVSFRTNEALVAFYKRGETLSDWRGCKFAIFAGIFLDLVVGLALFLLVYCNDVRIAKLLLKNEGAALAVQLYAFVSLSSALKSTPLAFLQATEHIKAINLITLVEHAAKLALLCAFAFFTPLTLRQVVIATLVPGIVAIAVAYGPLVAKLRGDFKGVRIRWEWELTLRYARFSANTFASSALKAGNQNLDILILGIATTTHIVGIYSTLRQFVSPFSFITAPFQVIAYPRFVKAVAEGSTYKVNTFIYEMDRKLDRWFILALCAVLVGALVYVQLARLTFNTIGYVALLLMAVAAIIRAKLWWTRPFSNAVNPNFSLIANLIATLTLPIMLYPLVSSLGLVGAAAGVLAIAVILWGYWRHTLSKFT